MEKKDVFYIELGTNFRYFLSWRSKLLAGYLVSIAGLAIGFSWTHINGEKPFSYIILLLGVVVALMFWALDYRNRGLYRACQKAGSNIEKSEQIKNGVYTVLEGLRKPKHGITHSLVLNIMFGLSALVFLFGAIFVYHSLHCPCLIGLE